MSDPWIKDEVRPASDWDEVYRRRWQHDRVVRSTHGVNCTGGCSWQIYVKDGIVTWEMQALDYPVIAPDVPPYEPRGCQRGMSFSWYLYSPLRVKYPYARGALLDLWRAARATYADPVAAWRSLVDDPAARARWQQARGKGGFRRADWDTLLELIAAASIHTIQKYGPDRIAGFSPIPAMSMVSYASGARFLQLIGGVSMSFYDWYCDLPNASPETWGEQTDVHESADWYNAKLLAVVGSNVSMTRTPDCHFAAEARHNGSRVWVFSPDVSQMARFADEWVGVNAGQDGAWWMAVNHVLLKEYHHDRQVPAFLDYCRKYTDCPFLVELRPTATGHRPGQLLRANRLADYGGVEHGDWKFLMWDQDANRPKSPTGSVGDRWGTTKGKWNLLLKDTLDGSAIDPVLTFLDHSTDVVEAELDDFASGTTVRRGVPAQRVALADGGTALVATVYDLLMAQYGVRRGLPGDYPADYDAVGPYTPAWMEQFTGVGRETLLRFAREWGDTAERTGGKCLVVIGAGVNHWYHANLTYRAAIHALLLCGAVGVNGGGLGHYVGQEKLSPMESWSAIAFARDWVPAPRLQNSPSWHYVHSDQWRYERSFTDYHTVPAGQPPGSLAEGHVIDTEVRAVLNGWLPFYPQFDRNPLAVVKEAEAAGATGPDAIAAAVAAQLKARTLRFAVEDPDAPQNWPRLWLIWRGNALMASAKGHEYFLKHYLGTDSGTIAEDLARDAVHDVVWRDAPTGKMDLVVDLNFRMDSSALYSDVVLPAATWYEKADLNSTDLHTFIHPLSAAVPPCWESKSDWQIFAALAKKLSALAATHFPSPIRDVVAAPLAHDTPAEIAQPQIRDWWRGEVEAVPGKTMPSLRVVTRDYASVYEQYTSFGPLARANGLGAHGTSYAIEDVYDDALETLPTREWNGRRYPSLADEEHVCNVILRFATVSNGELAYRSYRNMEEKVGLPLAHLAEQGRSRRLSYADLQGRPQRIGNSPMWSGLVQDGRAYAPYTYNVECQVPWRTLTGRQHLYLDHPGYLQFGEHLPTYKPKPLPSDHADLRFTGSREHAKELNFLTPHGKWHIHSTYGDTAPMMTLSRGIEPLWLNELDAADLAIRDNDWLEVFNDHGVFVTRAAVSARIPRGLCFQYHSPERTLSVPRAPSRDGRRAGAHNSVNRTRLKPNLMVGGYGQFTYHFNYWGPVGCNRDTQVLVRRLGEPRW